MYRDESDGWFTVILVVIFLVVAFGISSCVNDATKKEVESCMAKGGQWVQTTRDHFYCVMPK